MNGFNTQAWIGVDLDGTLAAYDGWKGPGVIGDPVPRMLERVRAWIKEGKNVRIFTARVSLAACNNSLLMRHGVEEVIYEWCEKHIGIRLPITCEKDMSMVQLWDDRCVQVVPNTGERADGK